ncbi:hypothetical protein FO519_001866 [Halicephalobus sp. NKZ332]|nr:hypothetical protein FO519_001866 [Halicephalobus sp. NKZ332]
MGDFLQAPARRTYNILCLGGTGSGKTTTLASLRSYVDLPTWRDAYNAEDLEFPTKLKFEIPRGRNVPVFSVDLGDDNNENHAAPGESCTQKPKTYTIQYRNDVYNFVDVPGFGDTRGLDQDTENSSLIVNAIRDIGELHMVLIFMKSTDRVLTLEVTYCLNECLAKLHVENIDQIGFVITHSRSGEYQVGDAVEAIRAFLEALQHRKNIVIRANNTNVYPMEHEAFKAIVGLQQRPELRDEINLEILQESWQETRRNVIKLLQDIPGHTPREALLPLAINEARTTIICLMEPLAVTANTIEANRRLLEEDEDAMIDMMINEGMQREYVAEENSTYPMTVCTSETCVEQVPMRGGGGDNAVKYKECHKPICRCDYTHHMHIKTDLRRGVRERYVERTDRPTAQRRIQVRLRDLLMEQDRILTAVAHFGKYLKEKAIITMNDGFVQVLQTQIENEHNAGNPDQVRRLQDVLKRYQEKLRMINTAENEGGNVTEILTAGQVTDVVNELFELPINGRRIQELYDATVEAHGRREE